MIRRKYLGDTAHPCPPGQAWFPQVKRCVRVPAELPARVPVYYALNSQTGWWCPTSVGAAQSRIAAFLASARPLGPAQQRELASLRAVVAGTAPRVQHVSPGSGCVRPGVVPGLSGMGRPRPRVVTMRGLGFTPETIGSGGGLNPNFNIPTISVLTFDPNQGVVSSLPQQTYAATTTNQSRGAAANATPPGGGPPPGQQPGWLDKLTAWLNGKGDVIKDVPNLAIAASAGGVGLVALAAMSGGKRR